MPSYVSKFTKEERKRFGLTLARMLNEREMSPAELSREATKHLGPGKKLGRDLISRYISGRSIPTPVNLKAIARVLGINPDLMIPRDYHARPGTVGESTLGRPRAHDVRLMNNEDGKTAVLTCNATLPRVTAWRIARQIEVELMKMSESEGTPAGR